MADTSHTPTQTTEALKEDPNLDPTQKLRENLEGMSKYGLAEARNRAIRDLFWAVVKHPAAQEMPASHESLTPPVELKVPEKDITIKTATSSLGNSSDSHTNLTNITISISEYTSVAPKVLSDHDRVLYGDLYSIRDMQAVVEDVIALRTLQEQLTIDLSQAEVQSPKV